MVYWIMISALEVENPLKRNTYYGAAELLYGDRYEIGCHSNWIYSVCFLKKYACNKKRSYNVYIQNGISTVVF